MKTKNGFTLAEVLITLAIIGVVAAMTIPTLIAKINKIVTDNQIKVFNAKLIKGLNLTKTAGDLNNTYTSTYDFLVNGLGKNLKMAKICDSSHIRDCIPYDKIKYDDKNQNEFELNVNNIKLNLNENKGFKDTAAFVLADGTPVVVSYNLQCIDDPDKADTEINECMAGIYDLNGTRKPNKMGKDLTAFNGASIKGMVLDTVGGVKIISKISTPKPIKTGDYCENGVVKSEYSDIIPHCCSLGNCKTGAGDYWAGAAIACKEMGGSLPTEEQLDSIGDALYCGNGCSKMATPDVLSPLFPRSLWSSVETPGDVTRHAQVRVFNSGTRRDICARHTGGNCAFVCVAN